MQTSGPTGATAPGTEADRHTVALCTYRRRRRTAVVVTLVVIAVVADFAVSAGRVLHEGGDTRFGIVPYLQGVVSAAGGGVLLVFLWRRAREARRAAALDLAVPEPEPRPHIGLSGEVEPPTRW